MSRDPELLHMIETLTREKSEMASSLNQSQELVQHLQHQLDEEKRAAEIEREKLSALLQQAQSSNQEETSTKSTISILIEEKNDLAASYSQCQTILNKTEEELAELRLDHNTLQAKFALSEQCRVDDVARLETSYNLVAEELAALKLELASKNREYSDLNEEFQELQMRQNHQTAELNQKETTVKELTSQIELLNLNMEQVS